MEYSEYLNEKLSKKINTITLLFAIFSLGVCFINFFDADGDVKWLILLPVVHLFGELLLIMIQSRYGNNLVHSLLFAFYTIQYQLYPLFTFSTGSLHLNGYSNSINGKIADAVFLQCIVLVFVTFYCLASKKYVPQLDSLESEDDIFFSKSAKRWIAFLIFASILLIARYPQFLLKFRLIFYSDINSYYSFLDASRTVRSSMPIVIYQFGLWMLQITKLLVTYYVVISLWRMSKGKNQLFYIVLSTMVVGLLCIITTEDKAATVFCSIAVILLMMRLYPRYIKTIIGFSAGALTIFIIGGFIVAPFLNSGSIDGLAYKLNAYFQGTVNVAGGLLMERHEMFRSFTGDIFRSIPMINHFFVDYPMSYIEFNQAIGYDTVYNSQIIPIIVQGNYYFGIFGAVGYPILLISFAKKRFVKMIGASGSFEFFMYAMLFVFSFLGLFLYDLALTFSQIMNYCFPVFCVYLISTRRRKYR